MVLIYVKGIQLFCLKQCSPEIHIAPEKPSKGIVKHVMKGK